MKHLKPLAIAAAVLLGSTAHAALSAHNTDDVLPNSPWKAQGQPDAGHFNPAGRNQPAAATSTTVPAAMTYYPPAVVISEPPPKPPALVAAPTLPCAPAYCPRRVRADRN